MNYAITITLRFKGAIKETVAYAKFKITISQVREIESIELNIKDNLIMYLSNGGEPSSDGGGCPFSVVSR